MQKQKKDVLPSNNHEAICETCSAPMASIGPEFEQPIPMVDRKYIEKNLNLSRSSIYRKMAKQTFPESVKVDNRAFWLLSELVAWQQGIIAERQKNHE